MNFKDYSIKSRKQIEENFRNFFESKNQQKIPEVFRDQKINQNLEEFISRGKLIRGTLFLLACEMFGEKTTKDYVDIACAIELMHSALLIHDDIIDKDEKRRGADTIYAEYIKRGKELEAFSPEHYGVSVGIVTGDVALFFAMELLSSHKKEILSELLKFYSNEIYLVALAEAVDSEFGQTKREPTIEEIESVYLYKTARYTFSLSFVLAGMVANSKKETVDALDRIGEMAGIIFQLKDDELGLFGEEEKLGKPIGSDIRENKKTVLRALLYENSDLEEKKKLDLIFGNKNLSKSDIEKVREIVRRHDIDSIINQEIETIMQNVWKLFSNLEVSSMHKKILEELLQFNIQRTY